MNTLLSPSRRFILILLLLTSLVSYHATFSPAFAQEKTPVCAINEFQLLGQSWTLSGAIGGIQPNPGPEGVVNWSLLTDILPSNTRTYLQTQFMAGELTPVLIIIVDDFQTPTPNTSHGNYVRTVAEQMLSGFKNSTNIKITTLDVGPGYQVDDIFVQLQNMIQDYSKSYKYFVLNLSFVAIPCSEEKVKFDIKDFIAYYKVKSPKEPGTTSDKVPTSGSLVDYFVTTLGQDPSNAALTVGNLLNAPNPNDDSPLQGLLNFLQNNNLGRVVAIASAGNQSRSQAYAPGSWPTVISVSGCSADSLNTGCTGSHQKWKPSNDGEVMAPAAWYKISGSEYVAGTSFASPTASVMAAVGLAAGNCNFGPLMNSAGFNDDFFGGAFIVACKLPR